MFTLETVIKSANEKEFFSIYLPKQKVWETNESQEAPIQPRPQVLLINDLQKPWHEVGTTSVQPVAILESWTLEKAGLVVQNLLFVCWCFFLNLLFLRTKRGKKA